MSSLPFPVSVALEAAINATLRLDPETRERLSAIDGKSIRINVQRPSVSVLICIADEKVLVVNNSDETADATISGSLSALRSLSAGNDALYKGQVIIDGDIGVAQQLKEITAGLDPDWQDTISPLLGDTLTHRLDRAQRQFGEWFKRTRRTTQLNTSEYLQEEAELLAPNTEVRRFCNEVDELRSSADRLEARLKRLEKQPQNQSAGPATC